MLEGISRLAQIFIGRNTAFDKGMGTTKAAKNTKIGYGDVVELKKILFSFMPFVCFVVISVFLLSQLIPPGFSGGT
jgi:hypothetical protein